MSWQVLDGDCIKAMAAMDEASVDAVVCDPPYGLEFMGKKWDRLGDAGQVSHSGFADEAGFKGFRLASYTGSGNLKCRRCDRWTYDHEGRKCECPTPDVDRARQPRLMQEWHEAWAQECLRVLKPGGHLLAFGGTRTYHRLTCAIEDAGFEIRDCIAWMYGSGFPKSLDVSKAIDKAAGHWRGKAGEVASDNGAMAGPNYDRTPKGDPVTAAAAAAGWGTALKPAFEPIVVARKPLAGTVAANVLEHGTGALNVDACRVPGEVDPRETPPLPRATTENWRIKPGLGTTRPEGRWPANVVLDEEAAAMLDEQTGELTSNSGTPFTRSADGDDGRSSFGEFKGDEASGFYGDTGGASRFFYVAKASSAERNAGLEGFEARGTTADGYGSIQTPKLDRAAPRENWTPHPVRNTHPTVKPIALMQWLVRLVTPPGGLVLDPFTGSGTAGIAALREGFTFIGIEREAEYAAIARARIAWWAERPGDLPLDLILERGKERAAMDAGHGSLFDGVDGLNGLEAA